MKELCAMTGFTITPNEEAMWEIMDPDLHHPSITLSRSLGKSIQDKVERGILKMRQKKLKALTDATVGNNSKLADKKKKLERQVDKFIPPTPIQAEKADAQNKYDRFIMPRVVDIAISLKVLHNRVPGANGEGLIGEGGIIKESQAISAINSIRRNTPDSDG